MQISSKLKNQHAMRPHNNKYADSRTAPTQSRSKRGGGSTGGSKKKPLGLACIRRARITRSPGIVDGHAQSHLGKETKSAAPLSAQSKETNLNLNEKDLFMNPSAISQRDMMRRMGRSRRRSRTGIGFLYARNGTGMARARCSHPVLSKATASSALFSKS
jgi:hypothetical protein